MRILIGIDASGSSHVAAELVAGREWPRGTSVRLVAVVARRPGNAGLEAELETLLAARAAELHERGLVCEWAIETGRAEEVLVASAAGWFADLVVVGSRGRGAAASAMFGSVSAHLVDHAPCPVLVARSARVERMLVATDGTRSCLDVPRVLAHWRPALHGVDVEILSIASDDETLPDGLAAFDPALAYHRRVAEEVADEMSELGWRAAAVARAGDPSREIVQAAEGYRADLVVTGSRCLGTLRRLLTGSVAHAVLLGTHASMLVVRGHVPAARRERSMMTAMAGS